MTRKQTLISLHPILHKEEQHKRQRKKDSARERLNQRKKKMKHIFKRIRNHDTNRTNGIPSPSPSPTSSSSSSSPLPPPTTVPDHRATLMYSPPTSSFDNSATTYADQSDFYNSEEEFQIQLALAISASNSEFRDKEPIRSTTLLSLERDDIESRRRRESDDRAELLSRRYWDYSVLDYDEKVVDGFYDLYGLSMDPASQGKMPSLSDLQTTSGDSNFEVVVVNRAIDPALEELHQVAHCIALDCPTTDTNLLVQRLADLVTEHLGGPVMDANIMLAKWMEKTMNSQTSVHKSILPIGSLTIGLSRHRALLYKVLADDVGIPCRLVKGSHYTGNDDDAINIIKLDNEREFLVDLMAAPGTLIPADVLNIKENSIISSNPRLGKTPSLITENNLGVDLSRMYVVGYGKTLFENDKHLNEGISSSEGTELVHSLLSANNGEFPVSTSGSSVGNSVFIIPSNQSQPSSSLVAGSSSQNKDSHIVDAAQKHLNEVPYSSGTIKESENLFADLNPLQGVGSGKTPIQSKPTNNGINSSQKKRENLLPAPGRPPLPLVWKNRSTGNELPRPRQNEFMERLLPRKNLEVNPYNASSMVSSRSNYSGNPFLEVHNVDNDTSRVSYPGMIVNGNGNLSGGGDSVLSLNTNQCTMLDEDGNQTVKAHLVIQSLGENRQDEYCRNGEVLLKGMVNNAKKHGKGISDKHNHRNGSDDRSMGTKSVSRHLDDSGSQVHAGPGRVYPMLEDVAEWEIPWEDLVIDERIGLGSYGEVFHADWKGTEVAVKKFLDQDFSGDTLDEFRSEVRIMRRLRHPNVVLFLGAVTRPPNLSIISEFLPRGSLSRILHRPHNQIDERHRIKMALDIAKGMNCLHTSIPTVVHRDLKSPNLLVDDNWNVKVSDFGLSRLKHSTFLSSKSTAGTPEWMAPEVLRNEQSNEKCDVYSFGVILWELATLRRPWIGLNPMQVVGVVGFQNRRLEIPAEVDPSVAKIMLECWQTDPSLRPSFAQLTSTLKTLQRLVIPSYQCQQSSHLQQEISEDVTP